MPKTLKTRLTTDIEQTDSLAWIIVNGSMKPLAGGGYRLAETVRILGAYRQKALALEHLTGFAILHGCPEQIDASFYVCLDRDSDEFNTYVRLEPLPASGYERPSSRDKHPLSTRIVRG
jgi:hypothetical protein